MNCRHSQVQHIGTTFQHENVYWCPTCGALKIRRMNQPKKEAQWLFARRVSSTSKSAKTSHNNGYVQLPNATEHIALDVVQNHAKKYRRN